MRPEEKAAVFVAVQADHSPFLWGPPGQGKSKFIRSGFALLGYKVHVIRVNTILPHHISGGPAPAEDGKSMRTLAPEWVHLLNDAALSVVFLDDVSCASPMGQTACMGLMDEKEIGGVKLRASVIAAGNPSALATARFDLDGAAANRCVHIFITSHGATFRDDVANGFPAPAVPKLRSNWRELIPRKADLVTRFLASPEGEAVLNSMPQQMTVKTVAWPSERTWEKFWQFLAACDSLDMSTMSGVNLLELRRLLLKGSVGDGALGKFYNYYTKPIEGDVATALRQGKAYSFPEEGDQMFGLLAAVSKKLESSSSISATQWNQAWSLLEGAWETAHRDRAVTFALDLISMNPGLALPPFYGRAVQKVLDCSI